MNAEAPVTQLRRDMKPRRPIECSLCGRLIGAWYLYQTTHYPHMHNCTERCERLIEFTRKKSGVPSAWREYPIEWRAPLVAAALVEKTIHE